MTAFVIRKDDEGFEHLAFAEVLVPNVPNVLGDFHTPQSVRDFAYGFMVGGFGLDVQHDQNDVTGKVHVVESFISRPGDTEFIVGSWVVGVYVPDQEIWDKIVTNEINGFSWDAIVNFQPGVVSLSGNYVATGTTQPELFTGHTHTFLVVLDEDGRPVYGGTSEDSGHSHTLSQHTLTDESLGHRHIYNVVK